MARIDAHHHLWQLDRGDSAWLDDAEYAAIRRDYGFADLAPLLAAHGIDGTVLVQAAPTVAETRWMLAEAECHRPIRGVIGWVDLDDPATPALLEELAADPRLRGVRPNLPRDAGCGALTGAAQASLETLERLGLVLEFYCMPDRLAAVRAVARTRPGLTVVLDHGGYPEFGGDDLVQWAAEMDALARETGCAVKFSGMLWGLPAHWRDGLLERALDRLLETFSPRRLMWGSDWPHVEAHGSYDAWAELSDRHLARLSGDERADIHGRTAVRVLGLDA